VTINLLIINYYVAYSMAVIFFCQLVAITCYSTRAPLMRLTLIRTNIFRTLL